MDQRGVRFFVFGNGSQEVARAFGLPAWRRRAQAAPRGDHRLRLSQHGRPCVRILSGVAGEGDSPRRFQDLSQSVVQPARVVKPDQGAAHAFALRGRPVDLPRRLVRPAAVAFSPRVPATSAKSGAPHVRPGARANVNPACEVVPLR